MRESVLEWRRMNEFSLLAQVFAKNATLPARIELPPGDDMGAVRLRGTQLLSAVDSVVEGVHFRLDSTPLSLVGRKALTRNLSDIAAMAARPTAALAAVVLPRRFSDAQAMELFEGMRVTALEFDCPLMGGDVSMHDGPLVCCVTVMAEPGEHGMKQRDAALVGDRVFVTGTLGGSVNADGGGKHLSFEPRINLALNLVRQVDVHAMIDISDGLGRDALHIAEQSNVSIDLEADRIPCTSGVDWKRALSDGEDYELCFTAHPDAHVPEAIDGVRITAVGVVREHSETDGARVRVRSGDTWVDAARLGWEHHA